jgi:hypothetical protein
LKKKHSEEMQQATRNFEVWQAQTNQENTQKVAKLQSEFS